MYWTKYTWGIYKKQCRNEINIYLQNLCILTIWLAHDRMVTLGQLCQMRRPAFETRVWPNFISKYITLLGHNYVFYIHIFTYGRYKMVFRNKINIYLQNYVTLVKLLPIMVLATPDWVDRTHVVWQHNHLYNFVQTHTISVIGRNAFIYF